MQRGGLVVRDGEGAFGESARATHRRNRIEIGNHVVGHKHCELKLPRSKHVPSELASLSVFGLASHRGDVQTAQMRVARCLKCFLAIAIPAELITACSSTQSGAEWQ